MTREGINSKLWSLGTSIWALRAHLDYDDIDFVNQHHYIRSEAAKIMSAVFLSDIELKAYLLENITATADELDRYGLTAMADYVAPQVRTQFFRKNFDYGEGWHDMMDKFRKGKIKGVHEWIDQRRNPKKKKRKKKAHHVGSRGELGESGYVIGAPESKGIDLGSSFLGYTGLTSEIVKTFATTELTEANAAALLAKYERLKTSSKKKKKEKDLPSYPSPFDSYCDSKGTREYWMKLKKEEGSSAVEDFLDYIKEVKCPVGQVRLASTRRVANSVEIENSIPPAAMPAGGRGDVPMSALPPREQMLRLKAPTNQASIYRHLADNPMRTHRLRMGDPVLIGDDIGFTGATGAVTGPHLHVEQLTGNEQRNPADYQQAFYPETPGGPRVTSPFGGRINPITKERQMHRGIDIGGVGNHTPIKAMSDGVVEFIGNSPSSGWVIKLRHYGLSNQGGV